MNRINFLTAGESHGKGSLGIIDGIPAGLKLSDDYIVGNWADENKSIFQVMKLEKIGLFLIVSCFFFPK